MAELRKSLVTKQPGKAIWTLGAAIFTVFQLPFWLILFIPRQFRQHPQWTYYQATMNKIVRAILYHSSVVEVYTPIRLVEKERFITINPSKDYIYHGLLEDPEIQPTVTGGTWYPSPYKTGDEQTILLHFHGGAYAMGEGRPSDVEFSATTLVKNLNAKALFISYRLASNEGCHFPAALQDAVTAYQYLLDQGISREHIVISGDSAGGSLALSLLRYISNSDVDLPEPSAAFFFSPWLDIKSARDPSYVNRNKHYTTDYLPGNFTSWGALAYIPKHMDVANPYFSPLDHPFATKTPLWIQVGGLEVLHDEGIKFRNVMESKGNKVGLHVEPLANHDILFVGNLTGFAAEAEKAVKLAGEFLRENKKK
ncbi:hypothetical protein MMC22_001132 [Lobaria immixta]|nr:hypothetical protein [Lobaria immixta]